MRRIWKITKWALGIGLVLLLVVGGLAAFLGPKISASIAESRAGENGLEIDIQAAAEGELVRVVSAPGAVSAKTQVNISSRVSAKIIELPFEPGDEVGKGDIIVRLDDKDLRAFYNASKARMNADEAGLKAVRASLLAEEASLLGVRASYDKAVADIERAQDLHNTGDISKADLDQAVAERDRQKASLNARIAGLEGVRANVEAALARVEVARADAEQAKENVEYATIRAPIDGVVINVFSKVGEVALGTISNQGAVIMQIADLSEMLVRARVAEVDVAQVKESHKARVYINGYPDEVFEGTVRRIALGNQMAGDGTSFFDTEITLHLEDGRRIFAGLTANVDIEVETVGGVVVIPSQAVVDRRIDELPQKVRDSSEAIGTDRTFTRAVFVYEDGKSMLRPVRVIASNLRETAIEMGIEVGDEVIVGPYRSLTSLAHDKGVRLREDEEATGSESEDVITAEEDEGESTSDSGDTTASTS